MLELRKSGIEVLGDIPWGTHFCHFYETKQDLLDILVPYFKVGLESNEFCLWIVSDSGLITVEEAKKALKKVVPDFELHLLDKNIEILNEIDWYLTKEAFSLEKALSALHAKLNQALDRGFAGVRASGDTCWLSENTWKAFFDYEKELNDSIIGHRVTIVCTYPLKKSTAAEMLDVAQNHQFAIARRNGEWEAIATATQIQARAEASRLNTVIQQIKKRTPALSGTGYGVAILSVISAVVILFLIRNNSGHGPHVSLFLCAVILSSWIGGTRPGLLATILSTLAFDYFFLLPIDSFAIEPTQVPRLVLFAVPALFIVSLSSVQRGVIVSLRRARNKLEAAVKTLDKTNTALRKEIVEHEKTAEKLIREKELANQIFDSIPGIVVMVDENLRYVRWNKELEKATGFRPEELPSKHPVEDFFPDEQSKQIAYNIFNDVFEKGSASGDLTAVLNGQETTLHVTGRRVNYEDRPVDLSICIDITERKLAEDKLRQSESLLAEAEQIAQIGSWSLDIRSKIVTWSRQLYRTFGVEKSEFDHNLESVFRFIHPGDRDFVKRIVEETVKSCEPYNFHFRLIRADGQVRIIHARGAVMTDDQGNAVRMYGTSQDVTERKRAEDELRLAYQRLSYHVENTPLAVIEWDKELFITRWSGQAEKIFGWKASEVLGRNLYDPEFSIIHEEDDKKVAAIAYELMNGLVDRNLILNRNYTKDGKLIYCEWHNSVLRDEQGNVITILSLSQDVTERKQAEAALQQSEDYLRLIIDTIPNMTWSMTPEGLLDFVNKRWQEYAGISLEELAKNPVQPIHPEDLPRVMEKWAKNMAAGISVEGEMRLRRADGEYRWFLVRTAPLRNDQGKIVKWYGVSTDIESGKRAENALRQSYEEIRRLTKHLQKVREEERTYIAREIHDELGQQLTAVKMDVVWIDKKIPEETNDIKKKLKNIIRMLDGSNESVRRILSELRPRVLGDHGLLEAIEWLGRQFAETTGIAVRFTTPEKDIKVSEQIGTNIFRICQEAFTNITRHSHAKNISVSIGIVEENITLVIEDDGVGFESASIQHKKTFGILGMRERVNSLDGKFELISSSGKGTKITASLPYKI